MLTDVDAIDDEFVKYLFQLVEEDPEDVEDDPFHYPVIRMLVRPSPSLRNSN